jgi:hypothetical protein
MSFIPWTHTTIRLRVMATLSQVGCAINIVLGPGLSLLPLVSQ